MHIRGLPEPRQRPFIRAHGENHITENPLQFVGLRDRCFIQIYPIGIGAAEEPIVRADRRNAVAILASPSWIPLPGVDDGSREIEGEGRRLSAVRSNRMKRNGGI